MRKISGIVRREFNGHHRADDADIPYRGMPLERLRSLAMNFLDPGNSCEYRLGIKNFKTRNARRAPQRIGRVGVPVEKSSAAVGAAKRLVNGARAEGGAHRQEAPGQPL